MRMPHSRSSQVTTRHQYCEPLHDYTSFDHETLMRDIADTIHTTEYVMKLAQDAATPSLQQRSTRSCMT